MVPKKLQQSVDASIELENLSLGYAPGDILQVVVKKIQINNNVQNVSVFLSLVGKIKTKVTKSNSGDKSDNHYYSEANFYNDRICVHKGPATHGLNSWPFTMSIKSDVWLEREGVTATLPSSYNSEGWERVGLSMRRDFLYCEYYLEAEIIDTAKPSHPAISTFPIFIRRPPASTETAHELLITTGNRLEVKTLHLDPQIGGQSLSFRQHMRSVFQRSTLPHYAYTITVGHAAIMQIEHPCSLPLRISASPDAQHTKALFALEKPPPLKLLSAKFQFQYSTHARHLKGSHRADDTVSDWRDWSRMHWKLGPGESGRIIPYVQNDSEKVLDIGREFQMQITWQGLRHCAPQKPSWKDRFREAAQVWPSTDSYHIAVKHQLAWSLEVECAGKTCIIRGMTPIVLLGPSQEWETRILYHTDSQTLLRAHRMWTENTVKVPILAV